MAVVDFSDRDIKTLRKMASWYRIAEGAKVPKAQAHKPGDNVWSRIVKTPSGGIPAYDEPDPGNAECDLCRKNDDDELDVIEAGVAVLDVWNASASPVAGATFISAWRDPWGTWWAAPVFSGAFFLTPSGGIPAATQKFTPSFVQAQRYQFNGLTIAAFIPPKFEALGNHIQSAIGGNKVVQAKLIDGSWFVDVEPC